MTAGEGVDRVDMRDKLAENMETQMAAILGDEDYFRRLQIKEEITSLNAERAMFVGQQAAIAKVQAEGGNVVQLPQRA